MRTRVGLVATLGFFTILAAAASADERSTAVIAKAIEAHGGADKLAKINLMSRSAKGSMFVFGQETPLATEMVVALPDRYRDAIDLSKVGQKMIFVVDGDKGWSLQGGASEALGKERLAEMREEIYILRIGSLLPLKNKEFETTSLPEIKVNGQPAVGVKIASKGHADANLYFDKRSGLLVEIERTSTQGGIAMKKASIFSDHKEFDGVRLATKYEETINGKKSVELTITSYKFLDKVVEGTFGKP